MALGGARPGAGRPKGKKTLEEQEFRAYVRARVISEKKPLIDAMMEKAKGCTVMEKEKVYSIPPDPQAFKAIVEHGFGKPPESLDVTSGGKALSVVFDSAFEGRKEHEAGEEGVVMPG